jgi:hypothetical protein
MLRKRNVTRRKHNDQPDQSHLTKIHRVVLDIAGIVLLVFHVAVLVLAELNYLMRMRNTML